jgi:hypothetical protein
MSYLQIFEVWIQNFKPHTVKRGVLGWHYGREHADAMSHARGRHVLLPRRRTRARLGSLCVPGVGVNRSHASQAGASARGAVQAMRRACAPPSWTPLAAVHTRRGEVVVAMLYSLASLSREAFYTPMHASTTNSHLCRSSHARKLCRTPLASSWANSATICSGRRSTPRASPLDLARAFPVTCWPALLLTLSDFASRRVLCRSRATAARPSRLRSVHHRQSIQGELNCICSPFFAHLRPHIAEGDLTTPPRAQMWISRGIYVKQELVCNGLDLSFLSARSNTLEKSYKFVEKSEKCKPNFVGSIRLDLQLLQSMTILLTYRFSMKIQTQFDTLLL